jgi:hypothetical protein
MSVFIVQFNTFSTHEIPYMPYTKIRLQTRLSFFIHFINILFSGIIQQKYTHFKKAINEGTLYASHFNSENEPGTGCTITERYSHCACYFDKDKAMYVFGGCTSPSTTFNDLWRFDLTPKQWIRPLAMGKRYKILKGAYLPQTIPT